MYSFTYKVPLQWQSKKTKQTYFKISINLYFKGFVYEQILFPSSSIPDIPEPILCCSWSWEKISCRRYQGNTFLQGMNE